MDRKIHNFVFFSFSQLNKSEEKVIFCPKYIFVQRYQYQGPFKTKDEAELLINSL